MTTDPVPADPAPARPAPADARPTPPRSSSAEPTRGPGPVDARGEAGVVRPLVVLAGPPGSGKSTVARLLAMRLGVAGRDTDHDVEAGAGRRIPQIFTDDGEDVFRAMETDALYTALRTHEGILSLGGGAPLAPYNQELLAQYVAAGGLVVFLDVTPDAAVMRMGTTHGRPLLGDDPRARFVELMAARRTVYEHVATLRVETSTRTPDEVADVIVTHLHAPTTSLTKDQH